MRQRHKTSGGSLGGRAGFSLLELMVAVVIIGILAALAVPVYLRATETAKFRQAVASLEQIRQGEIIYHGQENTYWSSTGAAPIEIIEDIEAVLKVDLDTKDRRSWDYRITSADADDFTAEAERLSGVHRGEIIVMNKNGLNRGASNWTGPWP